MAGVGAAVTGDRERAEGEGSLGAGDKGKGTV